MDKETLKNILNFIKENDNRNIPFTWKLLNNEPFTEDDLNVKYDLFLANTNIKSLPKGLKVGGDLNLLDSEIRFLPEGLEVGGDLNLENTNITFLPKGLKVGVDLFLAFTGIELISDGLFVGGDLHLDGCRSLESLPKGLKVLGDLEISESLLEDYSDKELLKMIKPGGYIKGDIIRSE